MNMQNGVPLSGQVPAYRDPAPGRVRAYEDLFFCQPLVEGSHGDRQRVPVLPGEVVGNRVRGSRIEIQVVSLEPANATTAGLPGGIAPGFVFGANPLTPAPGEGASSG